MVLSICNQAATLGLRQGIVKVYVDPDVWVVEQFNYGKFPLLNPRPPPPPPPPPPVPPIGPTLVPVTAWGSVDAYWWASLCRANSAGAGDDSYLREVIACRGPIRGYVYTYPGPHSLIPTFWYGQMEDRFVIGVNGTENPTQAVTFVMTHALGAQTVNQGGYYNTTFANTAQAVYNTVYGPWTALGSPPLLVLGHSYGGAVAGILYNALVLRTPRPLDRLVTFGAPNWGTVQSAPFTNGLQYLRFANMGDPVPLLPPPAAVVYAFGGAQPINAYPGGDYTPQAAMLVPQPTGGILPTADPNNSYVGWAEAFTSFLATGANATPHYALSYAGLMGTWFSGFPSQLTPEYAGANSLFNINALMAANGF